MRSRFGPWLVVAMLGSSVSASADDTEPLYRCRQATGSISVQFAPATHLKDLIAWTMGFTCKNVVISTAALNYAGTLSVIAPNKMTPKQAMQLFVDSVEATGLVVTVKPDTIVIKLPANAPRGCTDASPTTMTPSPKTAPPPTTTTPPPSQPLAIERTIKKIDDTHYEIQRAGVDAMLANPMAIAQGARVVAAIEGGKPVGFKLYAIRPQSVWARLGFANGDTLLKINGFELTSPDKALEVYSKLRDATSIEVEITRRGKPVSLFYSIR